MQKKSLVIVESPTKARTISRFLGSDFMVESSYGHVRDLPRSKLGVDPENNFEPQYLIPKKASPNVKKLRSLVPKADRVILATDEDREGEAIAWHLIKALGLDGTELPTVKRKTKSTAKKSTTKKTPPKKPKAPPPLERIVFHEITKKAIDEALLHPRALDVHLVDAQQARRILDRLVGYKLSPFLWKKVYRGLSAGRVQSVAVRLIVEREREIEAFKPEEYWSIVASLLKVARPQSSLDSQFDATLAKINGEMLDKFAVPNEESAKKILEDLHGADWMIEQVEKKATTKNPLPPYTTSTLQQDAFRRIRSTARQTMRLAQQLYEGVELGGEGSTGLITYMRTDSVNVSNDAIQTATGFIKQTYGEKYVLPEPRRFKTKSKGAQEAHEAIRPSDPTRTPDMVKAYLDAKQFKLYDLIWRRFIATQMPQAVFDATTVDVAATPKTADAKNYTFRANGQIMRFDGFLKVYPMQFTESLLPELEPKENLELKELKPEQHFTQAPARYTEASLVKILEKNGIGRPSTYAPIISTIQDRGYVERYERRYLKPTETGLIVNDLLVEHFPGVVDPQFTAKMEEELDEVARGKTAWQPVIRSFYEPFEKNLMEKYETVEKKEMTEETNEVCDICGKPMIIRMGRFGRFLACSGFPDCKNTKAIKKPEEKIGMQCPECKEGDIIIRKTKRGKIFFGCSRYPECKHATWNDPRKLNAESGISNQES